MVSAVSESVIAVVTGRELKKSPVVTLSSSSIARCLTNYIYRVINVRRVCMSLLEGPYVILSSEIYTTGI